MKIESSTTQKMVPSVYNGEGKLLLPRDTIAVLNS